MALDSIKKQVSQANNPKNHKEAVAEIAEDLNVSPNEVKHLIEHYFGKVLTKCMSAGKRIKVSNLGTFKKKRFSTKNSKKLFKINKKKKTAIVRI